MNTATLDIRKFSVSRKRRHPLKTQHIHVKRQRTRELWVQAHGLPSMARAVPNLVPSYRPRKGA